MTWKPTPPKRIKRPEQALQMQVMRWLDLCLPRDALAFAVPNTAKRGPVEGRMMKMTGTKAGIPDLCIVYRGRAHFIEMKALKGRLSPAQSDMCDRLVLCGAIVTIARSLDEVRDFVGMLMPVREVAAAGNRGVAAA